MPVPPDDLPPPPSGRVPAWVVDEAARRKDGTTGWQPPPTPARTRRRSVAPTVAVVVAVALGCTWWLNDGTPRLPGALVNAVGSMTGVEVPPALRQVPPPTAEVVALADEAHLSDEGRELLYGARPELLDAAGFVGRCEETHAAGRLRGDGAVGCYQPGDDTIVAYVPADPRLRGFVVETVAHETLHAAWTRLTAAEQAEVTPLLEAEVAALDAGAPLHEQLAGSVGDHPETRPTELFAYVGTQVWRDGGLSPRLEAVYARFVADRAALVAVHTGFLATLDAMRAEIEAAYAAVVASEEANATARAQYDADAGALEYYRSEYQAKVAEVAAMSPDRRQRLELSWQWWDGTDMPMAPADETLGLAADLLARDDVELPARGGGRHGGRGSQHRGACPHRRPPCRLRGAAVAARPVGHVGGLRPGG
ncbi:hypothetical protein [Cellulomonas sp. URHB0016]